MTPRDAIIESLFVLLDKWIEKNYPPLAGAANDLYRRHLNDPRMVIDAKIEKE